MKKILTVAGHDWQSALNKTAAGSGSDLFFFHQNAAEAVVLLAAQPQAYSALALEEAAGGHWLATLLDLTLGDSDGKVPLMMLGATQISAASHAGAVPSLQLPVNRNSVLVAMEQARVSMAKPGSKRLSDSFPDIKSIRVRYQPLVRLRDLQPTSVEVLTRVLTKDGKLIGPGYVVDAMTNSKYAMQLTGYIVQVALGEAQEGKFEELGLNFAFNLPLDAMLHPDLISMFETMRGNVNMPAKALGFELTESQPVTDFTRTAIIIDALRAAGYRLALDDITPQTPDLDALLNLPFRGIKLDRSVVTGAASKTASIAKLNREFISDIVNGAKNRQQSIVAEGIETAKLLELMRELGVSHGQGYFFARPLPARALQPWLNHWQENKMSGSPRGI